MKLESVRARLDRLSVRARIALALAGYAAAFTAAVLALFAYEHFTSGPDRDASSGMYAFADALFFLAVLAAGSVAPTGLLLHALRRFRAPWRVFATLAMAVAPTGWLAAWDIARASTDAGDGSMLAIPRVFVAPLLVGLFVLLASFSPDSGCRRWLLIAAGIECATSLYVFVHWFVPVLGG